MYVHVYVHGRPATCKIRALRQQAVHAWCTIFFPPVQMPNVFRVVLISAPLNNAQRAPQERISADPHGGKIIRGRRGWSR